MDAALMHEPPAIVEQEACSLEGFTNMCVQLLREDQCAFVKFALTGQYQTPEGIMQACVDPLQHRPDPDDVWRVEQHRDYDSLIGISKNLPFRVDLEVFPIPQPRETLKEDIKIDQRVKNPEDVSRFLCIKLIHTANHPTVTDRRGPWKMYHCTRFPTLDLQRFGTVTSPGVFSPPFAPGLAPM